MITLTLFIYLCLLINKILYNYSLKQYYIKIIMNKKIENIKKKKIYYILYNYSTIY